MYHMTFHIKTDTPVLVLPLDIDVFSGLHLCYGP